MQSGAIKDWQISRSSDVQNICEGGAMFRLFNQTRDGFSYYSIGDPGTIVNKYIQVDLGQLHTLTGTMIQGVDIGTYYYLWVLTFRIRYESATIEDSWLTYSDIYGADKVRFFTIRK